MNNQNNNKIDINFIFLRHGNACHNALSKIGYRKKINDASYKDPELTHYGADMSIWIGCLIKNILKIISNTDTGNQDNEGIQDIEDIHIVGCSPLLRSMETAYFMSRNWNQQPEKIQVFPLLRELDERIFKSAELTKYSDKSIYNIPEYAIKPISEQKEHIIKTFGKTKSFMFDFSSVIKFPEEREEPGDIERFIIWFYKNLGSILKVEENQLYNKVYNVLIITHAGVIKDFFGKLVLNNLGFVLQTSGKINTLDNSDVSSITPSLSSPNELEPEISINNRLDIEELFEQLEQTYKISQFFNYRAEHVCGINGTRCTTVCEDYNSKGNKPLNKMDFKPVCREINIPVYKNI